MATENASIVVIGAGVVGASVAYHLTERGAADVLILESEAEQGRGSTGKATGGVRSQFETEINIRLSLYSIDFFRNWDVDCGYDPKGYLFFATDSAQLAYLRSSLEKQKSLGADDVELIDSAAIADMVPGMNCTDIVGGTFGRRDGFINPIAVMKGFTECAVRNGASFEYERRVSRIETFGGRVRGVVVDGDLVECESVVVCSGALAKSLAATAGVDLPVEPQRRQIVWARSRAPLADSLPMVIDVGSGFHFRPAIDFVGGAESNTARNSDVLFAYPDPDEPPSDCTDFDEAFVAKVYEIARHRAPFLYECQIVPERCRAGLYENTPDHHAILGGCDVEGLYFASGFSGHGVMHSPATGRALAEIMLDGRSNFLDVSCLSLSRFASGNLLHETAFI